MTGQEYSTASSRLNAQTRRPPSNLKVLRRSLLRSKNVDTKYKCKIAAITVLTAFDYNCATWRRLNAAESKTFNQARTHTLRAATELYSKDGNNYTANDVAAAAGRLCSVVGFFTAIASAIAAASSKPSRGGEVWCSSATARA